MLAYLRFHEPRYAVSRFAFVLLDLTALIEDLLDQHRYRSLTHHVAVDALRRGALQLSKTLDRDAGHHVRPGRHAEQSWRLRQRYLAARAHVTVQPDRADRYVATRREWEPAAERVASALGYKPADLGASMPAEADNAQT